MANDSKKDNRQLTDAAIKIALVVIGGALGLALSYASLNILQSEVSKALIEVGETKASIKDLTSLVKRIEKEKIDLKIADKAIDLVKELSSYSEEVDFGRFVRKMNTPIVYGDKNGVTLPVRKGDLIEVTVNASARGKFCFEIQGDEDLVETVVDSRQVVVHLTELDAARIPISTNAIFRAKQEGDASFKAISHQCWMSNSYKKIDHLKIKAKILTNPISSGKSG